ncbi:MAG: diguanylate cyclase [Sporomusaceae bacterium]|nr:diguanylate cyclase [Sporomusaceae bacterium]
MRFSSKIAILLAALIAGSGLIHFLAFDRLFFTTTNTLLSNAIRNTAQTTGENLAAYFQRTQEILKSIARDPESRNNRQLLEKFSALLPEINMIFVLDANGNLINSTAASTTSRNFSQRDYFIRAMSGETTISNVFTSAAGRQVIMVSTPIRENGRVNGVVAASVWLHDNFLMSMFDNKTFGDSGDIIITDAEGIIVYHSDKRRIGQAAHLHGALPEKAGTITRLNEAGTEQYIGYYTLPDSNWLVTVETPTDQLTRLRRLMLYQSFAVSLITLCLTVAIGVYTLRRGIKPFEDLVQALGSLRKGSYHELNPADYSRDFSEVIKTYNLTVKRLETLHSSLRGAANIDELTGAYNRRAFEQAVAALDRELQAGTAGVFTVMFIDLDNFKEINDRQGHSAGDTVLRDFAALARSVVGARTLFRYGGDEFVIILRLPLGAAVALAEQIRSLAEQKLQNYTVSIGIAAYPDHADSSEAVLSLADKALYISKERKNSITVSG